MAAAVEAVAAAAVVAAVDGGGPSVVAAFAAAAAAAAGVNICSRGNFEAHVAYGSPPISNEAYTVLLISNKASSKHQEGRFEEVSS